MFLNFIFFILGIVIGYLYGKVEKEKEKEEKREVVQSVKKKIKPGSYKLKSPKEIAKSEQEKEVEGKMSKLLREMEE